MSDYLCSDLKNKQIDKVAFYYFSELKPLYEESYKLASETIKSIENLDGLTDIEKENTIREYIKYIKERDLSIQNIQRKLKAKRDIFEKMRIEFKFNGSDIKETDRRIERLERTGDI